MDPTAASSRHDRSSRRRNAHPGALIYERLTLLLLFSAPLGSLIYFGGRDPWHAGPFLLLSTLGLVLFFVRPLFQPEFLRWSRPPAFAVQLLFVAYLFSWLFHSPIPWLTRFELLQVVNGVLVLWAWTDLVQVRRRPEAFVAIMIFVLTLVAWYALANYFNGSAMVLNVERQLPYYNRVSGTFTCPNHLAHVLMIGILMAIALCSMSGAGVVPRLIAGYGLLVMLPAFVLTQSRGGLFALLAGCIVLVILLCMKRGVWVAAASLFAAPLLALGIGAAIYFSFPEFKERLDRITTRLDMRHKIWMDMEGMLRDRPLWGHGPGTFRYTFAPYRDKVHWTHRHIAYAHSEYLHTLAEYGIAGLALVALFAAWMLGALLWWYHRSTHRSRWLLAGAASALIASAVHALFDFNFHLFANSHLLLFVLGIACGSQYLHGMKSLPRVSTRTARGLTVAGLLASLLLLGASLRPSLSALFHYEGMRAEKRDQAAAALAFYHRAHRWDPGYAEPCGKIGNHHLLRASWSWEKEDREREARLALDWYEKGLARNSEQGVLYLGKAQSLELLGEKSPAEAAYWRAVEQEPTFVPSYIAFAQFLKKQQRYQEAFDLLRRIKPSDPDNPTILANLYYFKEKLPLAKPR